MSVYLEACRRALAQGGRQIVRRPLASLISTFCLGVGIAACGAAWSLVDAAILRPFGLQRAGELVVLWETDPARGHDLIEVSHLNFLDWQRESRTLSSMAAFGSSHWPALARIGDETAPLAARAVSATFFPTLGIRPVVGRGFDPSDLQAASPPPVILSHRLWQSRFSGATGIVGRPLFIDGADHHVIGVMPSGFGYPDDPDVWLSLERALGDAFKNMPLDAQRQVGILEVIGRRERQASNADVRNELTSIARTLRARYHEPAASVSVAVSSYADVLFGRLGSRLWIALALAAVVLVFAIANVTAVRLAHLRERSPELTARLFLGASRPRLIADLAIEAVPLVGASLATGWLVRLAIITLLSRASVVAGSGATLDADRWSAGLALVLLGVPAWMILGPITAWLASKRLGAEGLVHSPRVARGFSVVGSPLVLGQAAIAIACIAVAGAALQTFARLSQTDVGFSTAGVTLVDVSVPGWKYESAAAARQLIDRLRDALRELPGVRQAAAVSLRPFRFGEIGEGLPVRRSGEVLISPDDATAASRVVVTTDYFQAIGQPILEGRAFSRFDSRESEPVVVVSRALALALWGDVPAVGRRLETYTLSERWRTRLVVGVAADARYRGLERPSSELYMPDTQAATPLSSLVVASQPSGSLDEATIRQALRQVEPEIAIERIQTTGDVVQSELSPARLLTTLTSMLGGTGLLLLALGTFGAASAALRAARAEIAIRQALGARPVRAVTAPLVELGRALAIGASIGLLMTPLALSAAARLGLGAGGRQALPLAAGLLAVLGAALAAAVPTLVQAARVPPAELLRRG